MLNVGCVLSQLFQNFSTNNYSYLNPNTDNLQFNIYPIDYLIVDVTEEIIGLF